MASLNLTDDQREQMDAAREASQGSPEAMRAAMERILTTEQQQQMRARFDAHREEMRERLRQILPPDQFERFEEHMEQRRREGGPFGPPGGPGFGPPPPDGQIG